MKLKRRSGGHVLQRQYYDYGAIWKKRSERFSPLGPFKVEGRDFVAIVYFNRWTYYRWILKHGLILFVSLFYSQYYYRATGLAAKTKGMLILDDKVQSVSDKEQQIRVARAASVWIDVYLSPAFPPRLFNHVDAKMKLEKKIFKNCRNRKTPRAKNVAEKLFFERLKEADQQIVRFYPIFEKYHKLLKNATNLFHGISDRPSEGNMKNLKSVMDSLALSFDEQAKWCEERAESWTDFIDSFELYKKSEDRKKSLLKRYGPSAIWNVLLSAFADILSGGNFAFSVIFPLISWFGIEGCKMILSFRWQAKTLRDSAFVYKRFAARARMFSKIYDIPLRKGYLR
ncbi:hypothetical protein MUP77_23920 [Candidatus Bathyarchaeota archaeon]|nr:hypothetical protein [Candidatus Bathyarchaeota archaeon]